MVATLKQIAEEAQISVCVVSKVLNNKHKEMRISEETRQKILKIAKKKKYRPNLTARNLRLGKTNVIGVFGYMINDELIYHLLKGISKKAAEHEKTLLYLMKDTRKDSIEILKKLVEGNVDGIITFSALSPQEIDYINKLFRRGWNIATTVRQNDGCECPSIMVDNVKGGFLVTEHLIKLGHVRIGYLGTMTRNSASLRRFLGYKMALEQYNIALDEELVVETDYSFERGYEDVKELLLLKDVPTAVFCCSDMAALGAKKAVIESGKHIPDNIALVGYDDIKACLLSDVPLTTVHQPLYEIGKKAVEIVAGEKRTKSENILFEPRLVIRESCGTKLRNIQNVIGNVT